MALDPSIPLQSRLQPNPVGLGEMMQLGQAMRQRRAESEQRRKGETLKSLIGGNLELGPEGPKLNKRGFLAGLINSGMPEEAMQFQGQFQAEESKKLEAAANQARMISKRQSEIFEEQAPMVDVVTDDTERANILKLAFNREKIPHSIGEKITAEQWAAYKMKGKAGHEMPIAGTVYYDDLGQPHLASRDPSKPFVYDMTSAPADGHGAMGSSSGKPPAKGANQPIVEYDLESGGKGVGRIDKGSRTITPLIGPNATPITHGDPKKQRTQLSQGEIDDITMIETAAQTMNKIEDAVKNIGNSQRGPVAGRVATVNPYNVPIQTLENLITMLTPALARGVFREVGVLTEADMERYSGLLPRAKSDPSVANSILNELKGKIQSTYKTALTNYGRANRDISGFDTNKELFGKGRADSSAKETPVNTVKVGKGGKKYQKIKAGPDSDKSTWGEI